MFKQQIEFLLTKMWLAYINSVSLITKQVVIYLKEQIDCKRNWFITQSTKRNVAWKVSVWTNNERRGYEGT